MYNNGWNKLIKNNDTYRYEPNIYIVDKKSCKTGLDFTQLAFDHNEERVIVLDTRGYLHCIELFKDAPCYKRLVKIGQATSVAFSPICKGELLIGLNNGDIKIWNLHKTVNEFCLLSGHKLAITHISFHKNYCLTCSRNEGIIWHLHSYKKIHKLKVNIKNAVIKKGIYSNVGHIIVLYHNDTMQAWIFKQLDKDIKIDLKKFGTCYIKDFSITKDGRSLIMIGMRNIIILNTYDWNLLQKFSLSKDIIHTRQLSVVPCPLDGGANKIVALLSSKYTLYFYDISTSCFLETPDPIDRIKKFIVSSNGRYIAYIDLNGCLNIRHADKIILRKSFQLRELSGLHRFHAHKISDHLKCVRQNMNQELNIKRLMPILKEFGEYPEKYRAVIWSSILKLPANRNAYVALANKTTYTKFISNNLKNHPLADKNKASLLTMTIDCLFQWCPLLVQSPFLPNFVFPFLMVFQKDPLLAFELILSILLNYCQNWFEYHPLPPLNVLGIIENILLEVDPVLLNIFCEYGITSSEYAWPLLQTAMSEVLSGDEWVILWDHLISRQQPSFLLLCVISYSIYSRENIISIIKSCGDIQSFYSSQSHIKVKDLLRIAENLDQKIPERVHPNRYLKDKLVQLNSTGPYPLFILKEYPQFLIENFCIANLEKLKMEEYTSEYNCKAAEFLEKKRLHNETDAFVKQIHQTRLNEVQKCFQERVNHLNWDLKRILPITEKKEFHCQHLNKDAIDSQLQKLKAWDECTYLKDKITNFKDDKSKNYKKLQEDVIKLVYEVQIFLDSLRSNRTEKVIN